MHDVEFGCIGSPEESRIEDRLAFDDISLLRIQPIGLRELLTGRIFSV